MIEGTPIKTVASCPMAVSIAQFIQFCFVFLVKLTVFRSGKVTKATGYFFSGGAGAEAARSEFHMSAAHFQFPSVCFSQTSRYFPRSSIGLPVASFIVNSCVPLGFSEGEPEDDDCEIETGSFCETFRAGAGKSRW